MLLWFAFDSIWYIVNMQHAYGICICNFGLCPARSTRRSDRNLQDRQQWSAECFGSQGGKQKALYISEGQSANFSLIIDIWYIYAKETGGQIVFRYMIYVSLYFCNITIISSTWFEIQELLLQTVLLLLSHVHGAVVPRVPGDRYVNPSFGVSWYWRSLFQQAVRAKKSACWIDTNLPGPIPKTRNGRAPSVVPVYVEWNLPAIS